MKKKQEAKEESPQQFDQPAPFTPGVTRSMVREHAYRLYRDKLDRGALTLEDWVLAEKDLVQSMQTSGV
jgi:hypothetical protein